MKCKWVSVLLAVAAEWDRLAGYSSRAHKALVQGLGLLFPVAGGPGAPDIQDLLLFISDNFQLFLVIL